jgi:pectin methylesterase-like acyl-CoA thioesterase
MKVIRAIPLVAAFGVVAIGAGGAARAAPRTLVVDNDLALADDIVVTSSIQAAVDSASPGDTVIVPPGRYHDSVRITKSGITIRGSRGSVLDASGFNVGIRAAAGLGGPGCPSPTLSDIAIDGLRIENASFTGVLVRGVDGFAVRGGFYTDNDEYAILPICSQNGTIDSNEVGGDRRRRDLRRQFP